MSGSTIVSCSSHAEVPRDRPRVRELVERRARRSRPRSSTRVRSPVSAIAATTALESMPPERNAPSGTSLIRRSRTDFGRAARRAARDTRSSRAGVAVAGERQIPVALDGARARVRRRAGGPAGSLQMSW